MAHQFSSMASMESSETIMPSQYFDIIWRCQLMPEQKLLLGILEDAVYMFQTCSLKKSKRARNQFEEVRYWIFEEKTARICGFQTICTVLDIDPDYIRGGLRKWLKNIEKDNLR